MTNNDIRPSFPNKARASWAVISREFSARVMTYPVKHQPMSSSRPKHTRIVAARLKNPLIEGWILSVFVFESLKHIKVRFSIGKERVLFMPIRWGLDLQ